MIEIMCNEWMNECLEEYLGATELSLSFPNTFTVILSSVCLSVCLVGEWVVTYITYLHNE